MLRVCKSKELRVESEEDFDTRLLSPLGGIPQ